MGKNSVRNLLASFYEFVTKRARLVILVIALIMVIFVTGILSGFMLSSVRSNYQTSDTFSSVGVLKAIGIGVYWDSELTNKTTAIDWGIIEQGTQKSFTLYISNEGNSPVTLSMSTSNWNESNVSSYIALTWNYNGQAIDVGVSVQVTLTLTVNSDTTGISNFNFDVSIVGSG